MIDLSGLSGDLVRILALLALLVLPGAYLAFSPLASGVPAWTRLALSHVLSWPVAVAAYLFLRLLGLGNTPAAWLVALASLPALRLLLRADFAISLPYRHVAALVFAISVPPAALAFVLVAGAVPAFWEHAFLHTSVIAGLAENAFTPENRYLAGVTMTYPWTGHAYLLQLATIWDRPTSSLVVLTGPFQLLVMSALAISIVRRMGGGLVALTAAPLAFALSVNPIGTVLRPLTVLDDGTVSGWYYRLGDVRYDLAVKKFFFFSVNSTGQLFVAALAVVVLAMTRRGQPRFDALALILAASLCLIYPLYLPVALALLGAHTVSTIFLAPGAGWLRPTLLAVMGAAVSVAAYGVIGLQTAARLHGSGVGLRLPPDNFVAVGVALSLPVLASAVMARTSWIRDRAATATLILAGGGTASLATLLSIPHFNNEYKFVLAAAVILAPFVALLIETLWSAGRVAGRMAVAGMASLGVLAFGFVAADLLDEDSHSKVQVIDGRGQAWRLPPDDPRAAVLTALGETPPDTIVVLTRDLGLDVPNYSGRSLYAPPEAVAPYGLMLTYDYVLADVLGYGPDVLSQRRETLQRLVAGSDAERAGALDDLLHAGRPLAIIAEAETHEGLSNWLVTTGRGSGISAGDFRLWLITPGL